EKMYRVEQEFVSKTPFERVPQLFVKRKDIIKTEEKAIIETHEEQVHRTEFEIIGRTPFEHVPQLQQPTVSKIKKPKEVIKEEAISTISRLVKPKIDKEKEIETIQKTQLEYP